MAKDPAFLFYPGDYLRDTQCLSEKSQVAYDRIMCEHMRNICITQQQLNFFIKRLSEEEKTEVMQLMKKIPGGFQIEWVAESICKRRDYSKSRAENRKGKPKNISSSYDSHMENANENTNEINNGTGNEKFLVPEMFKKFKTHLPKYPGSKEKDFKPLYSIAVFLAEQGKVDDVTGSPGQILEAWDVICQVIKADKFYSTKPLSTISNAIQEILQIAKDGNSKTKRSGPTKEGLTAKFNERFGNKEQGSGDGYNAAV